MNEFLLISERLLATTRQHFFADDLATPIEQAEDDGCAGRCFGDPPHRARTDK
ncbi:hypothetical protein [Accumulibacter sp.]|uniref:hypothetical protein n=1 Tax=Accumulibacter sp. TaxID=2053492 RepID=UPI00262E876D|nr:hypothetical protein [Accumulibacter sp.]